MTTDVIETLCSIDDRADQIIENAAAQKKKLAREFDEKAQDMTKKVQAQARERMKALEMKLDAGNAEKIRKMSQDASRDLELLDENYKTNHDKYVREIFARITGD